MSGNSIKLKEADCSAGRAETGREMNGEAISNREITMEISVDSHGTECTDSHGVECADGHEAECSNNHESEDGCCQKKKKRSPQEYRDMMNRLNRIEGQVRGLKRMVDEDAYCPDILVQVSAVQAALNSFNKVLLANHIRTCVAEDIRGGRDEVIDELVKTMQKLMK